MIDDLRGPSLIPLETSVLPLAIVHLYLALQCNISVSRSPLSWAERDFSVCNWWMDGNIVLYFHKLIHIGSQLRDLRFGTIDATTYHLINYHIHTLSDFMTHWQLLYLIHVLSHVAEVDATHWKILCSQSQPPNVDLFSRPDMPAYVEPYKL